MKSLAIVGYRGFTNEETFNNIMQHLIQTYDVLKDVKTIISGGAVGVDTLAKRWALRNGYEFIEICPDYKTYGNRAPLIRNKEIVQRANEVVALPSSQSKGTKHTISCAKEQHKKCYIVNIQ